MTPACGFWHEVGHAAQPAGDPRLRAHLDGCGECRAGLAEIERAAAALASLPYEEPDDDAREQARTRLVAAIGRAAPHRRAPRRLWVKAAVALAASLGGATVLAAVGTRILESRREAAVEEPARPATARPRGRGHGGPTRAAVEESVAPPEAPPSPLVSAPPAPPAPTVGRAPAVAGASPDLAPRPIAIDAPRARPKLALHTQPPRALPLPPPPAPRPTPSPAELAFNQGWEALRAGSHGEAAAHMERALALGSGGALDEDARYLRAVALGRAGASRDARLAMEQFLRMHPRSARAGTVAAMLGWLLVDAQERALARAAFRTAEQDPSPKVRQSARAGLELLGAE